MSSRYHRAYKAFAILATLLLFMIAAATANAATRVYWTGYDNDNVGAASPSGGARNADFITGGSDTCGNVAVSRKYIYWTNDGENSIGRATISGHDVNQNFITGASDPCGVTIYAGHLYWTNDYYTANSIGRATVTGKSIDENFITGAEPAEGITAHADHLYWMGANGIARANINGTGVKLDFIPTDELGGIPENVAVSTRYIYWTADQSGTVGRADINASHADSSWLPASVADEPSGVAVTSQYVYWGRSGAIGRVDTDGTHANASFITGTGDIAGLEIGPPATTTKLSRSAKTFKAGKRVTYTAAISPIPDGGSVRFTSDGKTIHGCKAVKVSLTTGRASCHTTFHKAGKYKLRASYSGDSDFYGSKSASFKQTVKR